MKTFSKRGFTLIELLLVVVIIGILSGSLFMMVRAGRDKAAIAKTTAQIHAIATLLEEYKAIYGDYPVVQGTDSKGYAPVNYHFVISEGTPGCKSCGFKAVTNSDGNRGDEMQFGLCSHFVPRATTVLSSVADDSLKSHYKTMFKTPASNTPWETEIRGLKNASDALSATASLEQADLNLQQIYRVWRRLQKEGMVIEGATICVDCAAQRYSAGTREDAWNRALKYRVSGGAGEVVSAGPDGKFGTADDISAAGAAVNDED